MTATLENLLARGRGHEARKLAGRLRFASLPTPATLADFDFDAAPGIDRKLVDRLATCRYLESATNVLLIGPPGVGRPTVRLGLEDPWSSRYQVTVSVLVTTADPKQPTDPPAGGCLCCGSVVVVAGTGWPTIVGLIRKLGRPPRWSCLITILPLGDLSQAGADQFRHSHFTGRKLAMGSMLAGVVDFVVGVDTHHRHAHRRRC